jgi:hypothetical protein
MSKKKTKAPKSGKDLKQLNKKLGKLAKRGKLSGKAKERFFNLRELRQGPARKRNVQV